MQSLVIREAGEGAPLSLPAASPAVGPAAGLGSGGGLLPRGLELAVRPPRERGHPTDLRLGLGGAGCGPGPAVRRPQAALNPLSPWLRGSRAAHCIEPSARLAARAGPGRKARPAPAGTARRGGSPSLVGCTSSPSAWRGLSPSCACSSSSSEVKRKRLLLVPSSAAGIAFLWRRCGRRCDGRGPGRGKSLSLVNGEDFLCWRGK